MRELLIVVAVGCGSMNPADVPADHRVYDLSSDTDDAKYIRYGGKQVEIADIPQIATWLGLPVGGTADIVIDVEVPKPRGKLDYSEATGTISITCTECQIGDDRSKLALGEELADVLGVDGIAFGRIEIDRLEVKATIADGRLTVTSWKLKSPDLELDAALVLVLDRRLVTSEVQGCLRFQPTTALRERDPRMFDLLSLTGAAMLADRKYYVALEGTFDGVKRLAKECGPSRFGAR